MKKVLMIIPLALLIAGGAYKFALAKPKEKAPEPKVHGEVYILPKDFLVNLADGRFAKLNVAFVFEEGFHAAPAAAGGHGGGTEAPEGYGVLVQEALVRDIITDTLTDAHAEELTDRKERERLKEKVAKTINKKTDVKVHHVLFTDVAVQ
jgi:flagellar FliL protein